ncbi:RNase P modulator RnpM [Chloroflexus sp.]|uniref:RNase P modulator RnpM n=1 Tax=Chloroflexus sp. TaxID=1904827 RepID=UPI002ACE6B9E|nr:YlxR family protein [Chloroflexus sp.]MCX7860200.1 YlxR family protein [Chloroflexus sp.]
MAVKAKSGGARPRHVPQRTCIVCRQSDAKRALIRLVRDATGRVAIDSTGKRPGRGAYLCHNPECWTLALRRHAIERALKIVALHPDDRAAIEQRGRQLLQETMPTASS